MYDALESQVADPGEIVDGRHLLSLKTFLLGTYWCIQRIRGFTTMRYINQLFTYFTYLWCCRIPSRWSWGNPRRPTSVISARSESTSWNVTLCAVFCFTATVYDATTAGRCCASAATTARPSTMDRV